MKRLTISRNGAINTACVSAITRVFFGTVIDSPELLHAGWISIILGGILSLPLFLCFNVIYKLDPPETDEGIAGKLIWSVIVVTALLDSAVTARCISNSASYTAFNHAIRFFLLVPLYIAVLWSLNCGGNAIGDSARLWSRVFPMFFVIILVSQITRYHWTWLTPILGPGIPDLFAGAVKTAGWMSSVAGILLLGSLSSRSERDRSPLKLHAVIVFVSVLLVLTRYMMAPTLTNAAGRTRIFQLDIMLTNGRAPLILQLPLIVVWFISLMNLLTCDCFITATGIHRLFPSMNRKICLLIAVIASAALSMSVFTEHARERLFSQWQFAANAAAVALFLLRNLKKDGIQHAHM